MLDRKKASWQDILQRLSESDLRNFVFQLAEDNRDLQKKIVLDFSRGKPSAQEMHRYHAYQALGDDEGYKQVLWEHIQHFNQGD